MDNLHFKWDHTAPTVPDVEKENPEGKRDLAPYFKFLAQVKPHRHELLEVTVYPERFSLE